MPANKREYPVRKNCGSKDVTADAVATWDIEAQDWKISGVLESTFCNACEDEWDINWMDEVA
jgi:hypothetical protein